MSIAGATVAIVYACFVSDAIGIVSAAIYGFFAHSSLCRFDNLSFIGEQQSKKRFFRVLDHCSIFLC
ncbi:MAG: hypothetical protein L6V93_09670 [Clostridiales bacterium]|nr:MAG: hypothetical protein L6V93_09670 [Clostridiales bacterium]